AQIRTWLRRHAGVFDRVIGQALETSAGRSCLALLVRRLHQLGDAELTIELLSGLFLHSADATFQATLLDAAQLSAQARAAFVETSLVPIIAQRGLTAIGATLLQDYIAQMSASALQR